MITTLTIPLPVESEVRQAILDDIAYLTEMADERTQVTEAIVVRTNDYDLAQSIKNMFRVR